MKSTMKPMFVAALAAATFAVAPRPTRAASVADGFPDPEEYVVASGESAAVQAFDSFVSASGISAGSVATFHSFVSASAESAGSISNFNSNEAVGIVIVLR